MAQKVNIIVESDLSGKGEAHTVEFGLDGTDYEIDLTTQEAEKFRDAFAKYVGVARPIKGRGKSKRSNANSNGPSPRKVREWARENGHEVPDRGRIPEDVRKAYDAAN